jgi:molybdopterin/thiamine biosynthesis adenylyltransferase
MCGQSLHERYVRQLAVIGEFGQERLVSAAVFIAGTGGLGSVIAAFLASVGIGCIRLVDGDIAEWANLNRQFLYSEQFLGRNKAEAAKDAGIPFVHGAVTGLYRQVTTIIPGRTGSSAATRASNKPSSPRPGCSGME